MQVEMKVRGLMMDPVTRMPIIILRDRKSDQILPIWVGLFEANAIALEVEKIPTPRPMTHDLLKNVIGELGGRIEKIGGVLELFVFEKLADKFRSGVGKIVGLQLVRLCFWQQHRRFYLH